MQEQKCARPGSIWHSGHDPGGSISTYWIKIQISQQPKSKAHNYGRTIPYTTGQVPALLLVCDTHHRPNPCTAPDRNCLLDLPSCLIILGVSQRIYLDRKSFPASGAPRGKTKYMAKRLRKGRRKVYTNAGLLSSL